MRAERLALGTAQFGLPYGVANETGQLTREAIETVLDLAHHAGVDTIDTAIAYGESEARLGESGMARFRVVTKLPSLPSHVSSEAEVDAWVSEQLSASLMRLRIPRVHAVLLHRPADLSGPMGPALSQALVRVRERGMTAGVGLSVYCPEDLDRADGLLPCSVVQLPLSVVDQRFVRTGWVSRLADAGVEVHARSIFLQGLLLLSADRRPSAFEAWAALWRSWDAWQSEVSTTALRGCLGFALSVPGIARVVVGVDGPAQFQEILDALGDPLVVPPASLASDDRELIEPTRWVQARTS